MKFSLAAMTLFLGYQQVAADGTYYKGTITVTNLAPDGGTCQTPVWAGIHDGSFDTYDQDAAASAALERIAEDGNAAPLIEAFAANDGGVWDGVVGSAPICPGESAELSFEVLVKPGAKHYFSYTSMILPSNDAFVANGDPMAFEIFDENGEFVEVNFEDLGSEVLDAGTEVNDELPENTAFFGQATPDTGVVEGGVVTIHPGFNAVGTGGILDDAQFANADFKADGYKMMSVKVTAKKLMVKNGSIKVANMAPEGGTCQTPTWIGIHDGTFNVYDRDAPISASMERLAEDGNNAPIMEEFAAAAGTLWDGVVGDAPLCPGDVVILPIEVKIEPEKAYYVSYASMVLPSNDAFIANGDPMANMVFDTSGTLLDVVIEDFGSDVLDAGSEMNDESPDNTAFFGQSTPDSGTVEGGVVELHPGFKPAGNGGILDDPQFANADFTKDGYQMMLIHVFPDDGVKAPTMAPNDDSGATSPLMGTLLVSITSMAVWSLAMIL